MEDDGCRGRRGLREVQVGTHRVDSAAFVDTVAGMAALLDGEYEPSAMDWVRDQVEAYEASGGREANTLMDTGIPVIIVTMRGAKSGDIRKIALMRVEHDGEYALVASYGGAAEAPRLVLEPQGRVPTRCYVQDGPEPIPVTLREVEGDERDEWWDRSVAVYPPYNEYQERTDRVIPVLVASPA